jgi:hypothetical protein
MNPDYILPASIIISGFSGWFAMFFSRRKLKAEAENVVVTSANELVVIVMRQLDRMQGELDAIRAQLNKAVEMETNLRMEVGKLRKRIGVLEGFIMKNGLKVPPNGIE